MQHRCAGRRVTRTTPELLTAGTQWPACRADGGSGASNRGRLEVHRADRVEQSGGAYGLAVCILLQVLMRLCVAHSSRARYAARRQRLLTRTRTRGRLQAGILRSGQQQVPRRPTVRRARSSRAGSGSGLCSGERATVDLTRQRWQALTLIGLLLLICCPIATRHIWVVV